VSPETFLRAGADGEVRTVPIKGTRPRRASPAADAGAARELLESAKDRAELVMIVDLERNDLGRVCRTGSVRVEALGELRSFATLHHLVGRVAGRLRPEVGLGALLRACFPGGSISGAPKRRAMEILRALEPVERNFFTGSLVWFGDDGSLDSSILIRTLVLRDGWALLGAGGGVVAESDPEAEWSESNHKAAPLAAALGFDPREAR
jgi:anthranilate/para-aminobenzoate synthase component I